MTVRSIIRSIRRADKYLSRQVGDTRRFLIDALTPMNFAVIAPVFRALSRDARISFYFTSSRERGKTAEIFRELEDRKNIIDPRRAALLRFDAYLTVDQTWATLPRGTSRIFMFHGVAGKYADVYDRPTFSMRHWDRIFFINRKRLENFFNAGAIDRDTHKARLVGYPKLDCLVNGSLDRDEVLKGLGMDPSRKVVLYAPTWSPYSSLNAIGEELVKQLCDAGFQVIVKLHDRSWDREHKNSGGIDWARRLDPILLKKGGILARAGDATPLLAAADVMITDHSSVGFEYLLVDRPLIRIDVPELIAATRVPSEYVSLLAEASETVRTAGEAVNVVGQSLGDPTVKSKSRKAVADELFFDPGRATSRAVRELYEVLELDPLHEAQVFVSTK